VSGRPWWNREPCGTEAARKRHMLAGEPVCQPCKDAHAAEVRWRYQTLLRPRRRAAALRRAHARFTQLQRRNALVPTRLRQMEREYQRLRKQAQRAGQRQEAA
jgi:hypothetical protein